MPDLSSLWLAFTALLAAGVNGAVGYGFSSILTPIALFWYSNKVLNPAIVLVEVVVNALLVFRERRAVRATFARARPVMATLAPGVLLGTIGLTYLAVNDVKLIVYVVLLPLAALQLLGLKRPIQDERRGGWAVGAGVGFLYALTTISGPPLAVFLRNQSVSKEEFRSTIAQIRLAESALTLGAYVVFTSFFHAGLVSAPSLGLLPFLLIPVAIGVPLGAFAVRSIPRELFARAVMCVDGVLVAYGVVRTSELLGWTNPTSAALLLVGLWGVVALLSFWSIRPFLRARGQPPGLHRPEGTSDPGTTPVASLTATPTDGPPG